MPHNDLLSTLAAKRPTEAQLAAQDAITAAQAARDARTRAINAAREEAHRRYETGRDKDPFIAGALWAIGYES